MQCMKWQSPNDPMFVTFSWGNQQIVCFDDWSWNITQWYVKWNANTEEYEYFDFNNDPIDESTHTVVTCDDDYESEKVEMCDEGTSFLRWFVLQNGEPTGNFFDTDFSGNTYSASGNEVIGSCRLATETPWGKSYSWDTPVNLSTDIGESIVSSFTVTKQDGVSVDISFDGWSTYDLSITSDWSRTFWQWNQKDLNIVDIYIKGWDAQAEYDVIWEV